MFSGDLQAKVPEDDSSGLRRVHPSGQSLPTRGTGVTSQGRHNASGARQRADAAAAAAAAVAARGEPTMWERLFGPSAWPFQSWSCYCRPLLADCEDELADQSVARSEDSTLVVMRGAPAAEGVEAAHRATQADERRFLPRRPVGPQPQRITVEEPRQRYRAAGSPPRRGAAGSQWADGERAHGAAAVAARGEQLKPKEGGVATAGTVRVQIESVQKVAHPELEQPSETLTARLYNAGDLRGHARRLPRAAALGDVKSRDQRSTTHVLDFQADETTLKPQALPAVAASRAREAATQPYLHANVPPTGDMLPLELSASPFEDERPRATSLISEASAATRIPAVDKGLEDEITLGMESEVTQGMLSCDVAEDHDLVMTTAQLHQSIAPPANIDATKASAAVSVAGSPPETAVAAEAAVATLESPSVAAKNAVSDLCRVNEVGPSVVKVSFFTRPSVGTWHRPVTTVPKAGVAGTIDLATPGSLADEAANTVGTADSAAVVERTVAAVDAAAATESVTAGGVADKSMEAVASLCNGDNAELGTADAAIAEQEALEELAAALAAAGITDPSEIQMHLKLAESSGKEACNETGSQQGAAALESAPSDEPLKDRGIAVVQKSKDDLLGIENHLTPSEQLAKDADNEPGSHHVAATLKSAIMEKPLQDQGIAVVQKSDEDPSDFEEPLRRSVPPAKDAHKDLGSQHGPGDEASPQQRVADASLVHDAEAVSQFPGSFMLDTHVADLQDLAEQETTARELPPSRSDACASPASVSLPAEIPWQEVQDKSASSFEASVARKSANGRASSLRDRMRAYEAACQAPATERTARARYSKSAPRHAATFAVGLAAPPTQSAHRAQRKLANVTEQRVLKEGVLRLHEELTVKRVVNIGQLPNTGAVRMLGSAFLHRLLTAQVELKSCMEGDVCAAQSDLRHLTAEQLLRIRSMNLDLMTESASHSGRTSFLELVDRHLFYKITWRCIRGEPTLPERSEPLHALGLRITLVLGASQMVASGWSSLPADASNAELPPLYVMPLPAADWPSACKAVVFHVEELWLEVLTGDPPDLSWLDGPVALIRDRSVGVGGARMLHWEILVLNPQTDDVLAELADESQKNKPHRAMTTELSAVLAKRNDEGSSDLRTSP